MSRLSAFIGDYLTESRCFNVSFCVWAFVMLTLPFTTFFMWPAAVILCFAMFLESDWQGKALNFRANFGVPYGLFLILIYLIPMTGILYSSNKNVALAEFECYMWLPLAPIFLLTTSNRLLTFKHIALLLKIYTVSVVTLTILYFAVGIVRSIHYHDTVYLYYSHFSFLRHPTYATLYATFAFILILDYIYKCQNTLSKPRYILLYVVEFILAFGIFCTYSRAGIIIFFIVLCVWGVYIFRTYPRRWKRVLLLFAAIAATFSLLMTTDIMPVNRFAKTKYSVDEKDTADSDKSEARIAIWKTSIAAIRENLPFGVGTGDAFDAIKDKSVERKYDNITERHYNSHNQYLQALLTNGIPGIVFLLLYFSVPLAMSVRLKSIHLFSIFLLLSLNCLFECMFEIRSGVDFFAVMIPLFILRGKFQNDSILL